jgi:hypothetical protein
MGHALTASCVVKTSPPHLSRSSMWSCLPGLPLAHTMQREPGCHDTQDTRAVPLNAPSLTQRCQDSQATCSTSLQLASANDGTQTDGQCVSLTTSQPMDPRACVLHVQSDSVPASMPGCTATPRVSGPLPRAARHRVSAQASNAVLRLCNGDGIGAREDPAHKHIAGTRSSAECDMPQSPCSALRWQRGSQTRCCFVPKKAAAVWCCPSE